ncbi:MAG: PQQ-binding-like beta-propeller repeat protein [Thermomicrobiales bacterium]
MRPLRFWLLGTLLLAWLGTGAAPVPPVRAQDASHDVPMFRGNPARTGEMPGPGPSGSPVAIWRFAAGGSVASSPAVVGGTVYVGSVDHNLYAVDAVSGAERWRFAADGGVFSSPAVVGGAVYIGSRDGYLYAIGDPSPIVQATSAAQAESARAAEASSATASAQVAATAQAMNAFPDALATTAVQGTNLPAGFANPRPAPGMDGGPGWLPPGNPASAMVQVGILAEGQGVGGLVDCAVYASNDEARAAFAAAPAALKRAGWQARDAQGVGHDATCLVRATPSQSEAVCYVSRDDVVIAAGSSLALDAADAVFANANDLAVWASGVYDQTKRPG